MSETSVCYVVCAERLDNDCETIRCVCIDESTAEKICEDMNASDRLNQYYYYEKELHK